MPSSEDICRDFFYILRGIVSYTDPQFLFQKVQPPTFCLVYELRISRRQNRFLRAAAFFETRILTVPKSRSIAMMTRDERREVRTNTGSCEYRGSLISAVQPTRNTYRIREKP